MSIIKQLLARALAPSQTLSLTPAPTQGGPLPGTLLRIFIPPGAVINLLNLEVVSPSDIRLIVRLPLLGGGSGSNVMDIQSIINAAQAAGGRVGASQ